MVEDTCAAAAVDTIQGVSIMWLQKAEEEEGVICRALQHLEMEKLKKNPAKEIEKERPVRWEGK